jgi:hypothetical protein
MILRPAYAAESTACGSGGSWSPCSLAVPTATQVGVWSTSGPWSPVVDELQPLGIRCCGFPPKPALSCDFASQQFSSLHVVSGTHVPRMCPALTGTACAFSLTTWMQTMGASLLTVSWCSPPHVRTPVQDSRSAHGLLYLAAVRNDSHHLIRRLCRAHRLPAHFVADLPRCYSLLRTSWRR